MVERIFLMIQSLLFMLLFVVKVNEQIRLAVGSGQRPDLSVITGPEDLMKLAVEWMTRCWHQSPAERPAFAGILHLLLRRVRL